MNTPKITAPKHAADWTPLRFALDRIRQDATPTGKRARRG